MAQRELPEITTSSKTPGNTPEVVNAVLKDLGYDVTETEVIGQQATEEEDAAATEAAKKTEEETAAEAERVETEAAEKEAEEQKSHNQKRRARQKAEREEALSRATAAEAKTKELEAQIEDLRKSTTKAVADVEEFRKNPPRAAEPEPLPDPPKRPKKTDFFEADDPDEAYEDAMYKFRRAQDKHEALVEDRKKPKPAPVVVETAAPAAKKEEPAPAARSAVSEDLSDAAANNLDPDKTEAPELKLFIKSVKSVTGGHPGAYKAIVENISRVNDAIIQAGYGFEEPARIALYLAKHPEESLRIKALTDGNVRENPKLIRLAIKELDKIEQLAAAEDAAVATKVVDDEDEEEDESTGDPETDASAARATKQPQRPAQSRPAEKATEVAPKPAAKKQPEKHTPIDPVGARGTQTAKRYEDMTAAEQKALPIDKVRELRGML